LIVVCVAVPLMVAFGRLYRGMHHLTDMAAGLLIGATCALLAYGWYLHRSSSSQRAALTAAQDSPSQPGRKHRPTPPRQ
jgi:membrane-associated phospholipid phosphatase